MNPGGHLLPVCKSDGPHTTAAQNWERFGAQQHWQLTALNSFHVNKGARTAQGTIWKRLAMRKRTTRRCFSEISEGEDSQGPGLQSPGGAGGSTG